MGAGIGGVEGVAVRHRAACGSRSGGACDCKPAYQAQVYSAADGRTIRKSFVGLADARAWRQETQVGLRMGTARAPSPVTLGQAAREWLAGARAGVIRTRSGERYKPSALRSYDEALRTKVLPALGHLRLSGVSRNAIQDLADRLVAQGRAPSTVRNAILPLRAIYRRALIRSEVALNPTLELSLPAVRARRERVARPQEAVVLLEALAIEDRALWASALYAGLRRGELRGLRWSDIDFPGGVIRVSRSWDQLAGPIEPKSRAGTRSVPLADILRRQLLNHRLRQGRAGEGLVFGGAVGRPFDPPSALARARSAWQRAGLAAIGLHECRHSYAAFMIAAGVNSKALSAYMGHASITVTLDRYGHLLPGNERQAAALLDSWLEGAS